VLSCAGKRTGCLNCQISQPAHGFLYVPIKTGVNTCLPVSKLATCCAVSVNTPQHPAAVLAIVEASSRQLTAGGEHNEGQIKTISSSLRCRQRIDKEGG
jgi:hypothetical protein